jgi:hypothetical protein
VALMARRSCFIYKKSGYPSVDTENRQRFRSNVDAARAIEDCLDNVIPSGTPE